MENIDVKKEIKELKFLCSQTNNHQYDDLIKNLEEINDKVLKELSIQEKNYKEYAEKTR